MNAQYELLNSPVKDVKGLGEKLYKKSVEVVKEAQTQKGGISASLKGTRYAGYVYPRDHAYSTRALLSSGDLEAGKKALSFILECPLEENFVMSQRYTEDGAIQAYKPPQIDGNAQTIVSLSEYLKLSDDKELAHKYKAKVEDILKGLIGSMKVFPHGNLVYSQNGIIEFPPFEEGYELYTNACCYAAFAEASDIYKKYFNEEESNKYHEYGEKIKQGIAYYLNHPGYGGVIVCMRAEPNSSIATSANLKTFLSLSDFSVFTPDSEIMKDNIKRQLSETFNKELGGYNRYAYEIGRHNFGNGPWPMVMLRLADWYLKSGDKENLTKCLNWVINVAVNNEDVEFGLPEHVAAKDEFERAYETFLKIDEISPREAKRAQYETIIGSNTYKKRQLAYAVNPLVWSHAQFITTWNKIKNQNLQ